MPDSFDRSGGLAKAFLDRLAGLPYVNAGCPARVELVADASQSLVFTSCPTAWPGCSAKLLVAWQANGEVVTVYDRDIADISQFIRTGLERFMSERHFDGHTYWYDLFIDQQETTCQTYIGSFDDVRLLMPPSMQYLVKDLMVKEGLILEPADVAIDPFTGVLTARFVPSKPNPDDGFATVVYDPADGKSIVVASSVASLVGLSATATRSCRVSPRLDELAPSSPVLGPTSPRGPRLV
jgi:hypothetical protein